MAKLNVLTELQQPMLWIWRDATANARAVLAAEARDHGLAPNGLRLFETDLDHQIHEPVHA